MIDLFRKPTSTKDLLPTVPAAEPRFEAVPKNYKFWGEDSGPAPRWEGATDTTRLANLPETMGGGQYAQDPAKPGALIKSERGFSPYLNKELRKGLPGKLVEIDHIMPLGLGGSDTLSNKQSLSGKEHANKTKVQAIVDQLFYNKKIALGEARVLSLNWKDKDVDGVKLDDDGKLVDPTIADKKYQEWQEVPKVGLKEWWEAVKSPAQGVGEEFLKGATKQLTLGYVDTQMGEYQNPSKQAHAGIARIAGEVTGGLLSFAALYGVVGKALQATNMGARALQGIKTAEGAVKVGRVAIPKTKALQSLYNAGVFTLHGQLSKQEEAGMANRVKNFFSDAAYGGVLGLAGQSVKGYAGLATGTYILSTLEGANPSEALVNTGIMVGLHGASGVAGTVNSSRMNSLMDKKITETRSKWGVRPSETGKYSVEEIESGNKKAIKKILEVVESPEEAEREISKVVASGRELYKRNLDVDAKAEADVADIKSVAQKTANPEAKFLKDFPNAVVEFSNTNSDFFSGKFPAAGEITPGQFRSGRMKTTGVAQEYPTRVSNDIKSFIDSGGKPGDKVMIVLRDDPEMIKFMEMKNKILPPERQYQRPDNNIQIIGTKNGELYDFGWWPRDKRLGNLREPYQPTNVEELPFSINEKMAQYEFSQYDPAFNKNYVADKMRQSGVKILTGKVTMLGREAKVSKNPWVEFEISDKDWAVAPALNQRTGQAKAETINKAIKQITKIENKSPQLIKNANTATQNSNFASSKINGMFETTEGKNIFTLALRQIENLFSQGDPVKLGQGMKNLLGVTLAKEEAEALLKNSSKLTVGNIVNFIVLENKHNRLNKTGRDIYNLLFSQGSFYPSLGADDRIRIRELPLFSSGEAPTGQVNTGEIPQEIKLLPAGKPMEAANRDKIIQAMSKKPFQEEQSIIKNLPKTSGVKSVMRGREDLKAMRAEFEQVKAKGNKKEINEYLEKLQKAERAPVDLPTTKKRAINVPSLEALDERVRAGGEMGEGYKKLRAAIKGKLDKIEGKESDFLIKVEDDIVEQGKSIIDNLKLPSQASGKLSRESYIGKIKELTNSLDARMSNKLTKQYNFSAEEKENLLGRAKERLLPYMEDSVYEKFNPKNEAMFKHGKLEDEVEVDGRMIKIDFVKEIEKDTKRLIGIKNDSEDDIPNVVNAVGRAKNFKKETKTGENAKTKWSMKWDKPTKFLPVTEEEKRMLADKLGRQKRVKPMTEWKGKITQALSSNDKSSSRFAFNKTLDDIFSNVFGKNYESNYALNVILDPTTKKGQAFWKEMYRDINEQGHYESQPIDVVLKRYKFFIGEGKQNMTSKDTEAIYGRRKAEAQAEMEDRYSKSKPLSERGKEAGEARNAISEAVASGAKIVDESRMERISDITKLDDLFTGMLATEAGKGSIKYDQKAAANDAKALALTIIKHYNLFFPGKKMRINPAVLDKVKIQFNTSQ